MLAKLFNPCSGFSSPGPPLLGESWTVIISKRRSFVVKWTDYLTSINLLFFFYYLKGGEQLSLDD